MMIRWMELGEHLCRLLLESREASSFIAVGTLQPLLALFAQMKLLQLRLPLLHAQVLRHSRASYSTQPGPSPQRNQRFASKNVLVHEALPAIALMTVASLEITHISDSPLAIIAIRFRGFPFSYESNGRIDHRWRFTSGDSLSTMTSEFVPFLLY